MKRTQWFVGCLARAQRLHDVLAQPRWSGKDLEFGDYVTEGVAKAVTAIEDITGKEQINAAGYRIGGTVLASTVAYYAAKRMKKRIKTATFFYDSIRLLSAGRGWRI